MFRNLATRVASSVPVTAPRRLISSSKSRLGGDHGHSHTVFDVTPEAGYEPGVPSTFQWLHRMHAIA
jgi:hypothetical protein